MDHESIMKAATADPRNTAIELPPSDVNALVAKSYTVDKPFTYTRTQLWDMEVRKAHDPETFLGGVVRPGSARVFNVQRTGDIETFVRVSDQRQWANFSEFATVIERVQLDHAAHRALFIGVDSVEGVDAGGDGRRIERGPEQKRFHVEHSCDGEEEAPLNIWRIVLVDEEDEDGALRATFKAMGASPYLRAFNEIYIRDVLGVKLERKE